MGQISHNAGSQGCLDFEQRNGIGWGWTAITGVVVLLALTGTDATAAELTPIEAVKSTIADVVHILDNAELNQPGRAAERRQRIEQVVKDRVSYEDMAKRALGVPWTEVDCRILRSSRLRTNSVDAENMVGIFRTVLKLGYAQNAQKGRPARPQRVKALNVPFGVR